MPENSSSELPFPSQPQLLVALVTQDHLQQRFVLPCPLLAGLPQHLKHHRPPGSTAAPGWRAQGPAVAPGLARYHGVLGSRGRVRVPFFPGSL